MPKADTELVVIDKTHELLVWTLKHIEKLTLLIEADKRRWQISRNALASGLCSKNRG